jgi:hypothetical protein
MAAEVNYVLLGKINHLCMSLNETKVEVISFGGIQAIATKNTYAWEDMELFIRARHSYLYRLITRLLGEPGGSTTGNPDCKIAWYKAGKEGWPHGKAARTPEECKPGCKDCGKKRSDLSWKWMGITHEWDFVRD